MTKPIEPKLKQRSTGSAASGPQGARVGRRRPRSAKGATRALLGNMAALEAVVAARASEHPDAARLALRYLQASHPNRLLGQSRAPMSEADQAKLAHAQADLIADVIESVLRGLRLSAEQYERGRKLAADALRAASAQGWEPL